MKDVLHGTRFLMAETAHDRLPTSQAEVAFVGRSNAGKSSLLCALTNNWKLARVSKTPGATRGINVYEARPGCWLVDLPGYGYAVGPERERGYWPEMIGRYLSERASLRRVYVLIDANVGAQEIDGRLVPWLREKKRPFRIVATKTDKIGRDKHAAYKARLSDALEVPSEEIFWVSSSKGHGLPALRQDILAEFF